MKNSPQRRRDAKTKAQRIVTPTQYWCVVVCCKRSDWFLYTSISYSKKGAKENYLRDILPEHRESSAAEFLTGKLRVAKVLLSELCVSASQRLKK